MPNPETQFGYFLPEETGLADKIRHRRTHLALPRTNEYAGVKEIAQADSR